MNNNKSHRDIIAHGVICAAICIGGWMMLVQPKTRALANLEANIAEQTSSDVPLTQSGVEALAARVEQVKSRVQDVQQRNALATDSARLYGEVMKLAESRGVLIERLKPGSDERKLADNAGIATRVDITAKGEYESMAMFLDDVLRLNGFMRPISLSIQPSGGANQMVSARIVCEAVRFNLPEQLTSATAKEIAP